MIAPLSVPASSIARSPSITGVELGRSVPGGSTSTEVRKPDLRARVQVVNGTHVDKLAGRSAAKLQETGFLSVGTIQALNAGQYPRSAIIDASDNPATARLIAATLGLPPASIRTGDANETGGFAIMVILGPLLIAIGHRFGKRVNNVRVGDVLLLRRCRHEQMLLHQPLDQCGVGFRQTVRFTKGSCIDSA